MTAQMDEAVRLHRERIEAARARVAECAENEGHCYEEWREATDERKRAEDDLAKLTFQTFTADELSSSLESQ